MGAFIEDSQCMTIAHRVGDEYKDERCVYVMFAEDRTKPDEEKPPQDSVEIQVEVKENPCGCEECEKKVRTTVELTKEEVEEILPTLRRWLAGERMRSDLDIEIENLKASKKE